MSVGNASRSWRIAVIQGRSLPRFKERTILTAPKSLAKLCLGSIDQLAARDGLRSCLVCRDFYHIVTEHPLVLLAAIKNKTNLLNTLLLTIGFEPIPVYKTEISPKLTASTNSAK